jgi:hypothetical protein
MTERFNFNYLGVGLKLINGDGEDFYIIVMDTGDDDEVRRRLSEYGRRSEELYEFQETGPFGITKKNLQ